MCVAVAIFRMKVAARKRRDGEDLGLVRQSSIVCMAKGARRVACSRQ